MIITFTLCPISIRIINTPTSSCYYTVNDMWGRYYAPISSILSNLIYSLCGRSCVTDRGREGGDHFFPGRLNPATYIAVLHI